MYYDEVLDPNIRTIESVNIASLNEKIVLEFDYLGGDGPYMVAKIIHCDWDWKKSIIMENEYLSVFNEFQLNDVEGSSSSYVSYYHYRFEIPPVKLSGNYILKIYDEDNPQKVYMYRRLSFYDPKLLISSAKALSNVVSTRYTHQQVDFQFKFWTARYTRIPIKICML